MNEDQVAHGIAGLIAMVIPDLWKAIPAAVLGLLAFGFRRMAARFLGLFARLEAIDTKVSKHLDEAVLSFRINDQTHAAIISSLADHAARSSEATARIERTIEAQTRRLDEIVTTRRA